MIDKNDISKLLSLDDNLLREKLMSATIAAGGDPQKVASALSDMKTLRSLASGLDKNEIEKLIGSFGEEKAQRIADVLKDK